MIKTDTLDQALAARQPDPETLIHHSDRGVQYLSIKYSERLEEAKIDPSVGSIGDSYDNAMAETINGLYKAEVIEHEGPWKGKKDVELPRSIGSTGSITNVVLGPSDTSLQHKQKGTSMTA